MEWLTHSINFRVIWQYSDVFLNGITQTIIISLICLVLSFLFGIFVALARMSTITIIWLAAAGYIQVVRGTPLLIQILIIYYGLSMLIGNFFDEWSTAIIALTFHTAPYMGEIIRAGIMSVDKGQVEGAKAVGMSEGQSMKYIILPQAIANVVPPLLGQTAVLIKDTSLFSIIAVFELMGAGMIMYTETIIATEAYVTTAICYLVIYMVMLVISEQVQRRLGGTAWKYE